MKACRDTATARANEAGTSDACPHWRWRSLLMWLPQPVLLKTISSSYCCMQHFRTVGAIYDGDRPPFCCKKPGGSSSTRRSPLPCARSPAAGELVHYSIAEVSAADAVPVSATERRSEAGDIPEGSPIPELSLLTPASRSRPASPNRLAASSRATSSPPSYPRLFPASVDTSRIDEPERFLVYQQTQHNTPRQLPSRCGDNRRLHLDERTAGGHSSLPFANLFNSARADQTKSRLMDVPPQDVTPLALERPHSPTFNGANCSGHKMPALDVLENPSRTEELDGIEGGRTLLEHRTRNAQVGLKLPTQLKNRTHHAQHAHGKGLPDPFSTASICGNLVAAVAEHPEELSPQSALQKKTPCGLNGHCHTEAVGSSGGSGPSNQLHLGSVPLLHGAEPSTQPAHDEAANGLQVGGLELGQLQTEVKENELNKPEHTNLKGWVGDQKVQREEEAPARIRSILSQEELLEPDEKNLDAASSRVAEYITNTQNMGATEANGQFDTATASPGGRILRSKTVTVPVLNASPVPRDIPLRQETTLVHSNHHKNSPPSVDCSRGRRKTGTSVGRQSVRRTQSDARGCLSGDMNLPQTPGGALGTLTEGLYSSRAPQWRGISVPRRSPQRLKEHLITRDTPESSLQYDRPSPSPRSQEGTVEISSDNVYAQERQVSSKDGPEGHMTFSSDSATAGVGERKESCCILLSSGGLSTSHMQVCHGRGCANSGQSHSAKQAAMIRSGERGRASGDRLTSLPSFAIQTTKAARERYKKPHNQVQSFSSQLQKRLRRRSITRRVKCKKGGQEVLLPHRDKKKSHEALCRLGNDDGATAVEQAPINDGVLKNSRRSMCSMEGPKASSPTLKYGLSGDENNPQNKVSEAHIGTGQYTTTVQPLDNHHARSPPPRSSSNSFIASGSLAGGSVRAFRAASNEGDICSKDGPPENVTACKGHPVKVNVSLYSYRTRNRRAASCIEPSLHGVPKLPVNKSAGCSERGSRSLSWSPGGAEDALVLPRQPRKVNVTNREKATRSQLKETPSTENVSYEGRTRSHRRRSVEDPPRLSEAEPTLGSVGPPYEGGKAARIASTFGPTDALPLQADGEAPQQGASASWVTRGRFWNDGRLKTKMLISGISAASSQSPYSQHGQTRSTNGPRQLLLDSQLFGNAATSAQLPHGRGVASGVRPNGIFLGLSMAIPGQCAKLGLTHEAVDVSTEVDGAPYFPGHHIVRHPQSMLLNEGGGRMGLSSNDNASGHPFMDPAGNTKSYLWADPRTSHSDGQGGYTEGKTVRTGSGGEFSHRGTVQFVNLHFSGQALQTHCCTRQANGAPNPGNLSGVAANYAEGDTLVHRLSDPQEEAALPSVVQPCPVFPKPLLIRNRTRERKEKSYCCSVTHDSKLHASNYCSTRHIHDAAGPPAREEESLPGAVRNATVHSVQSVSGAHRCSGALCRCSGTWQENILCHAPALCKHYMRESVLPVLHRGALFRRCCMPRTLYLREEALKWRIQSQRKHVYLLNRHITIQQQQLEQALQLQQTQFQERLKRANPLNNRPSKGCTLSKTHFGRRLRQLRLRYRKIRTACSKERPPALLEATAAATAAALAVVDACEQRARKMLAGRQTRAVSLGDSEKQLTGTSQSECLPNVTTERLPGLRQQPITAKLREETAQENPGISHTGLVSEECVQPTESKVPLQPQQSYTIVARDPPGCLPSPRETSDSSIHPAQGSADKNGNTLKLQLALPQISQPDNPERLGVGQHDPGGPTLPRAASEPACPKVAVGLELSFPSPGIIVSPKGGIDYDGSYSRMEVTLSPSLPIIRSVPIIKLQTKTSAGCDCEGASQGRRTEPSDYSAYVAPCRKCNSMPTTSTLFPSRGNLSRGSRASHIDSLRRGTVIRDGRSRQREDTNAETSSNKAGANPLGEVLRGTPARYRCNAIPMAYHRDPSISVFSQLFEDSFRRQRNLLILRRQKHLESTPGVRPEGTGGGESPQQISMLAARPLSRYDATSRSRETTKVVNKKQTVFRKPGRISGPREALKEKKVHSEISAMPTDGPLDNNGVRRKSLVMGDDAETQLCFHVEALCPAAAQATPHPETSICMHAATSRLEPLPPHTERFGTCLAAIEAESIN